MILVLPFLASVLTVVAFGGRLGALADLRLRWTPLLCGALALQLGIMGPLAGMPAVAHGAAHVASILMGAAVVVANRHVPGLWLVGLGGGANLAAVAANGGVMPASPLAVRLAGLEHAAGQFHNSAVVGDAKLAFLGDVFALPAAWPMANVFSPGDVLLVIGGAVVLHAACGSRLSRRRSALTAPAARRPLTPRRPGRTLAVAIAEGLARRPAPQPHVGVAELVDAHG